MLTATQKQTKQQVLTYSLLVGLTLAATFFLLQLEFFSRAFWLFWIALVANVLVRNHALKSEDSHEPKQKKQHVDEFFYFALGSTVAALLIPQIAVFSMMFGDMYGVMAIAAFLVVCIIALEFIVHMPKLPSMALGAIIYILAYSVNYTPVQAFFFAIAMHILATIVAQGSFALATRFSAGYTERKATTGK